MENGRYLLFVPPSQLEEIRLLFADYGYIEVVPYSNGGLVGEKDNG